MLIDGTSRIEAGGSGGIVSLENYGENYGLEACVAWPASFIEYGQPKSDI